VYSSASALAAAAANFGSDDSYGRADLPARVGDHRRNALPPRRGPVEERMILQLQLADHALRETTAAQNAVLRVVVRIRVLPVFGGVEVTDRYGTLVLNHDARARAVHRNL